MRALAIDFQQRTLAERTVGEPLIARDDQALFRVEEVGVCGTDRELAAFRIGSPPPGASFLVIGHEALGRITAVGSAVVSLRPGDWVVPMVRRGCSPPCRPCARGRPDLCVSGRFQERGIYGLHGYFCEQAVDAQDDLVRVAPELADCAILAEPLSVVEKAVSSAISLRAEPPQGALVIGAGSIGLLAALTLRLRGVPAVIHSLEPPSHPRARLVEQLGIPYLPRPCSSDIVIEATGAAEAAFEAIRCLGPLGVCVFLGASAGAGHVSFRDLVVGNQILIGSVNASRASFRAAIEDLGRFDRRALEKLICRVPFSDYPKTIGGGVFESPKLVHVIH